MDWIGCEAYSPPDWIVVVVGGGGDFPLLTAKLDKRELCKLAFTNENTVVVEQHNSSMTCLFPSHAGLMAQSAWLLSRTRYSVTFVFVSTHTISAEIWWFNVTANSGVPH